MGIFLLIGNDGDGALGDGAGVPRGGAQLELLAGLGEDIGPLHQVDGGCREDFARVDGGLVADGGAVAGDILPAVAGAAVGPCRHVDLSGGGEPAHIAHIGGTGLETFAAEEGEQEVIHVVTGFAAKLFGVCGVEGIVFAAGAGGVLAGGVGHGQGVGISVLLLGVGERQWIKKYSMDVEVLGMRFIFENVIRRAKLKGHLDMQDARRLSAIGIPIISICVKNTPIDNIEKDVDEWLNSFEDGKK